MVASRARLGWRPADALRSRDRRDGALRSLRETKGLEYRETRERSDGETWLLMEWVVAVAALLFACHCCDSCDAVVGLRLKGSGAPGR